ncbi:MULTISPECIES: sensor histidine kinase [Pseudonocardia]|uniref:histidine kinase n=2 Tax=Pseudonocardia TaxID=1847 RepID=A0A1Y2MJW7_PSEAH|nr:MULTISPECIES: sensor histidine kinase [Pseudonocardia]OSY35452.1 Signal transduction histidine-protein kinase/phosphatase DegS [Pseudonocardia autotrophica]TDN72203.1 histidine kinase [Pseudonocardia autotrophica]
MAGGTPRLPATAAATIAVLGWAAWRTPAFVDAVAQPCPDGICRRFERPSPQAVDLLAAAGVAPAGYAVTVAVVAWAELLVFLTVAVALVRRVPLRRLVVVTTVLLPLTALAPFTTAAAGSSPTWWVDLVRAAVVAVLVPVFAGLFPDDRWHPRWFRWIWPLPALVLVTGTSVLTDVPPGHEYAELLAWLLLAGIQVHRYRTVSDTSARQQAKVLLLVAVLLVINSALVTVAGVSGVLPVVQPFAVLLDYLAFAALGAGLGWALLRHRLYDVDPVLRRTALYGGALVGLAIIYVGLVAVAGSALSGRAAPALAGTAVGVLAFTAGLAGYAMRGRLRRQILGGHGLVRSLAALAREPQAGAGRDLASTLAAGLQLRYVQVLDTAGVPLWSHGEPVAAAHRESVVDAAGRDRGALLLAPAHGDRLDRHHRRVLVEILPFVALVLYLREETVLLRRARAAAAEVRETERRRLRRDLHDGVGPLLASQLLTLDTVRVVGERPELLAQLEAQVRSAIGEVRRVAHDLRPPVLDHAGLPGALRAEVDRLSTAGLTVELRTGPGTAALGPAMEVALLRIAQEALANVVRHSGADTARVDLAVEKTVAVLVAADDGRGPAAHPDPAGGGIGGSSMRERAAELGGTVTVGPGPGGAGTRVEARIPL